MSYSDHRQNRTVAIGAVVIVHAALGYALLTGLASNVIRELVPGPLQTYNVPEVAPPPPDSQPLPKTTAEPTRPADVLTAPVREVPTALDTGLIMVPLADPSPGPLAEPSPEPLAEPQPPAVSLARGASPRGNQGEWFPPDSYPAAAQRAGAQGLVSVRVGVGANGRVTDCTVTVSSGNADLDATTCRLAKRNGRFEPARDAGGAAIPSTATLRNVRWRLQD